MYTRPCWITNSSSSSFVLVTKDKAITPEFLRRVGFYDFTHEYYIDYKDWERASKHVSVDDMAKEMQPTQYQLDNPEDYAITSEEMGEIIGDLIELIPEAVVYNDPKDPRVLFYDKYAYAEDPDLWATYQKLLSLGYNVFHYVSEDEGGGPWMHVILDGIINKTYKCEETKEFVTKTSHH